MTATTLNVLSVKRKAAVVGGGGGGSGADGEMERVEGKKVKMDETLTIKPAANQVNVLGGSMVRKKPKKIQPTPVALD